MTCVHFLNCAWLDNNVNYSPYNWQPSFFFFFSFTKLSQNESLVATYETICTNDT
jgi:hypothetical protein